MKTTHDTSFLTLSGEIRNRIYEEVIQGLGIHSKTLTQILPCRCSNFKGVPEANMRSIVSSCHLGQVSRTVRKEFLSMLWRDFIFYYRNCKHCAIGKESSETLQSFAPMLRGNVTNLLFFIHREREIPSSFSTLANILLAIEFKGCLVIDGHRRRVIAAEEGLKLISSTGTYERDTIIKSIEKQIDGLTWNQTERLRRVIIFDITKS